MQQRAEWFDEVTDNLTNDDLSESTPTLIKQWLRQCALYVKTGGDVPPVAPPKP